MNYYEQNKAEMIAYLKKGCKDKETAMRFGVELEHFIVRDKRGSVLLWG